MKFAVALFCLIPWLTTALVFLTPVPNDPIPVPLIFAMSSMLWMMISPAIIALGILVAYREGQYSERRKK